MFSDDDAAELYDLLNPWDPGRWPTDRFYDELVMAAGSVLDVGCGTGAMLHRAREQGHLGRLVGLDPDHAALTRARLRSHTEQRSGTERVDGIEWVDGVASDADWQAEFDLATMTSNAFQCLVTDEDLRASLVAVHRALRPGGRFAFETRHPQARAWESWNPAEVSEVQLPDGRGLRLWHEVESVSGDVVTFAETTADPDGGVLRVDRTSLRFLDVEPLRAFLTEAGFELEGQYGDAQRGPLTATSRQIVTIARRPRPADRQGAAWRPADSLLLRHSRRSRQYGRTACR
ncbi:class I SAM-dependent methyltransferase [Streptacidiphilus sp. 4-A2]|nr:class I SAM-dependent methyltransferase [Streptacidiphilus sp. 4-A2]